MENYFKQLSKDLAHSLGKEILKSIDKNTLKNFDRNTLFEIIEKFITSVEYKGENEKDIENFMVLFNVLDVLIDGYHDEKLIEKLKKYPEIKEFIADLLYCWNYFVEASYFLFNLKSEFLQECKEFNQEYDTFIKEKESFDSTKTFTRQKEEMIANLKQWSADIKKVLDRVISTEPLPEGEEYTLTDRDKSLLINHLKRQISNKEDMSFNKVNLRLIDSQAVKTPYPADYEYDYARDMNNINFKQAIYAKGDIEIVIKKDFPTEILEKPIFYENEILATLSDRIIMCTENITLPLTLFFGILEGKDEVSEINITVRDQSQIIWEHGDYQVSKKWYDELKKIINKLGLDGLIEADWISEDDKEFIENKFEESKQKFGNKDNLDNPYIILANMLDRVIKTDWKGKTTQLHELIGYSDTFPDTEKGIQKLGRIMSRATEENIIPGFNIDEIRIGDTRQKGYHITRL